MKNKHGQITFFVILGIVILAVVLLGLTLQNRLTNIKLEEEIQEIPKGNVDTVRNFVIECLDKAAVHTINQTIAQGGFIFSDQGGLIDWQIPHENTTKGRAAYQIYGLLSNKFKPTNIVENPPFYPCYKSGPSGSTGTDCHQTYHHTDPQYFFGTTADPVRSINPDLCKDTVTSPGYSCTCTNPPNSPNCQFSIQAQLEHAINNQVNLCMSTADFPDFEFETEEATSTVTFGVEDTTIQLELPITILVRGEQPVIELISFSKSYSARVKSIYQLARELIEKDIDDITFSILTDGQSLANRYTGMFVSVDYFDGFSFVTINDTKSNLNSNPLKMTFARENRFPTLDYLVLNPIPGTPPYTKEIYILEGEQLFLRPGVFDSDETSPENPLRVTYTGWKSLELQASNSYVDGSNCDAQNQCADYTVTKADAGEHILTIKVEDRDGLSDSQAVRILVDDIPDVIFFASHPYDDVPTSHASTEDPFVLDASQSMDSWPQQDLIFRWTLTRPDQAEIELTDWTDDSTYTLPNPPNIKQKITEFDPRGGLHKVRVQVQNKGFTPGETQTAREQQFEVRECLPHRSEHASYPFHNYKHDNYFDPANPNAIVNEYMGNHTCCSDSSQITFASTCYNLVDWGCRHDFLEASSPRSDPGNLVDEGIGPDIINPGTNPSQDVYKRTLIRQCGDRGNMCSGRISTYTVERVGTCTSSCRHSLISQADACT